MGLTYQQSVAIGIGHLHPAASGGKSREAELLDSIYAGPPQPSKAPQDGMNKLERSFRDEVLEPAYVRGTILEWQREPIKLRLAGRCWYHPDFVVALRPGQHGLPPRIVMVELKGPFAREDSIIKLKVAAKTYSYFEWLLVRRDGRHDWDVRAVTRSGIGAVSRIVPWINGRG